MGSKAWRLDLPRTLRVLAGLIQAARTRTADVVTGCWRIRDCVTWAARDAITGAGAAALAEIITSLSGMSDG